MIRVLGVELRRGTPPLAALLAAVAMTWMLAVHPDQWAGQWTGLSTYLRISLLILCPLFVAAGAWQAGRERRGNLDELLATTARPIWQPLLVAWTAVTMAGLAGVLLPLVVAAVLVGVRASYVGPGWWWSGLVGLIALATATALGTLLGRLVPSLLVAPIAGVAAYAGLGVPVYLGASRWAGLSPVLGHAGPVDVWPLAYHAWQAGWLVALGATLFLLAARRWRTALLPALAAAALVATPAPDDLGSDPDAVALVCTDRVPQVCLARVNAFMLDDVAAVIEPVMTRMSGIPGAPVRAVDELALGPAVNQPDVLPLSLTGQATVTGGVAREDWLRLAGDAVVQDAGCSVAFYEAVGADEARAAAIGWLQGEPSDALAALPEDRREQWIGAVIAASQACDQAALDRLAAVLR